MIHPRVACWGSGGVLLAEDAVHYLVYVYCIFKIRGALIADLKVHRPLRMRKMRCCDARADTELHAKASRK